MDRITILKDNKGITAKEYGVISSGSPRLFIIDQFQTVQMDLGGKCKECIEKKYQVCWIV